MGLDLELFVEEVKEDLKCPICYRVLSNPVCGRNCDHLFCAECIVTWIKLTPECPMDRTPLSESDLKPAPKIIVSLLARQEIKCTNWAKGCCWIMQLKDLEDHLTWCLFDVANPKRNTLPSSGKLSTIKQIRLIADQSNELRSIRQTIDELKSFYEEEQQRSVETHQLIDNFDKCYRDLNKHLHDTTNPLCELLLSSFGAQKEIGEPKEDQTGNQEIETVSVRNLNEFITNGILTEYLRQNDIYVISCENECCHWQRSRDFRVEIRSCDLKRILSPDLWPRGVSVCALGPKSSVVFGERDKESASIVIQPGIIC